MTYNEAQRMAREVERRAGLEELALDADENGEGLPMLRPGRFLSFEEWKKVARVLPEVYEGGAEEAPGDEAERID